MGYSMRTDRYRLVVWRDHRDKNAAPIFLELYDNKVDPDETKNLARKQPALTKELLARFDSYRQY